MVLLCFLLVVVMPAVATKADKAHMRGSMKWISFISCSFVLNKMCDIIADGVGTDKDFKEVHLHIVAKMVFEFCSTKVTPT